jgi:hypothetical protein
VLGSRNPRIDSASSFLNSGMPSSLSLVRAAHVPINSDIKLSMTFLYSSWPTILYSHPHEDVIEYYQATQRLAHQLRPNEPDRTRYYLQDTEPKPCSIPTE